MKRINKKIPILILILIFGLFVFFGFKVGAKIFLNNDQTTLVIIGSVDGNKVVQQNFLLIHIDDLTKVKPQLISVWAAFFYPSDPPQLMFIPLYPSYDAGLHSSLQKKFKLNADQSISEKFVAQINKSFDIQISGYILTDDVGVGYSNLWLIGQETPYSSTPAMSDADKLALRMSGQSAYETLCQTITAGSSETYFSAIDWTKLLPSHFSTNIPFETIALITDMITRATAPVKCEVLYSQ